MLVVGVEQRFVDRGDVGASGTGNGTVTYSYTANTGGDRKGTVTVAGRTFTLDQNKR